MIQAGHTFSPFELSQLRRWSSNGDKGERDEKHGSDERYHVHSDSRVVEMCRVWLRCVKSVKEYDAGEKKTGKRPPFYTLTSTLIKAELEGHAQEDRREQPISGLRSGDTMDTTAQRASLGSM